MGLCEVNLGVYQVLILVTVAFFSQLFKWLSEIGLDWQATPKRLPRFFFILSPYFFFIYLIKNPQTTIPLTFLTHNFSGVGGVQN